MGRALNYLNFLAYIVNIIITFVVGTTGKFGKDNATVSAEYPTLFTPAGWAFSIWGIIFSLEALFSVYQLLPSVRDTAAVQKGIGPYWILMVVAQVGWSFAFSVEQIPVSMAFMVCIWLSLRGLVRGLRRELPSPSPAQRLFLTIPFSLNFGWITAASLANANILAVYRDPNDRAAQLAVAACSLVVAGIAAFASVTVVQPPDGVFCLVLVWASTAISKELASPKAEAIRAWPTYVTSGLSQAAAALAVLSAIAALYAFLNQTAKSLLRGSGASSEETEPIHASVGPGGYTAPSAPPASKDKDGKKAGPSEALLRP